MKNIKIEGSQEIEIKQFYLPVVIKDECPKCGNEVSYDLEDQYLSYPILNKAENIDLECEVCETEFQIPITLRMSIDISGVKEA